ncbi:MAG: amino acid adenylation domain-containing protein [Acidobacteriia bacterium]|nr:amino acid adenylation domain-containing protein [Terriglobia bacterium]
MVAGIWGEVLGREEIGREENFFELGGHSLLATQVMSRIRGALGVRMKVRTLFETPRLCDFAQLVLKARRKSDRLAFGEIDLLPSQQTRALSSAQKRLWFMQSVSLKAAQWHIPIVLHLEGLLNSMALKQAFSDLAHQQELLRTTIHQENGEPIRTLLPENSLVIMDVTAEAAAIQGSDWKKLIEQIADTPFRFGTDPLARAVLLRYSEQNHFLVVVLHHLVADGWSVPVLLNGISHAYSARSEGKDAGLPSLRVQFSDFVRWEEQWLASPLQGAQLDYWEQKLHLLPDLRLPLAPPISGSSSGPANLAIMLPEEIGREIAACSRQYGVTQFSILLAAWQAALARISGQNDFAVAVPVSARSHLEIEGLVAPLLNTVLIRTAVDATVSGRILIQRTHETLLEAFDHQDVPFQNVVEQVRPRRKAETSPIFRTMVALNSRPTLNQPPSLPDLQVKPISTGAPVLEADLILSLAQSGNGYSGLLEFDAEKFDREAVVSFARMFQDALTSILKTPDLGIFSAPPPVSELPEFLAHEPASHSGSMIVERIREHGRTRPEAPALRQREQVVSYGALCHQVDELSARLKRKGVGRGSIVALQMPNCPELAACLLAALCVEASYTILQPGLSDEEVRTCLENINAGFLATVSDGTIRLNECSPAFWRTAGAVQQTGMESAEREDVAPRKGDRAGRRRLSRLISPTNALNQLIDGILRECSFTSADDLLLITPAVQDGGVYSLLAVLSAGGSIQMTDGWDTSLPPQSADGLLRATVAAAPLAHWGELSRKFKEHRSLRFIILEGESLLPSLNAAWLKESKVRLLQRIGHSGLLVELAASGATPSRPVSEYDRTGRLLLPPEAFVLGPDLQPCKPGVIGELYLRSDASTTAPFAVEDCVPNRLNTEPGLFLLKTGEMAYLRSGGDCYLVVRKCEQRLAQGRLVDLLQMENALLLHREVKDAAALMVLKADRPALMAFVVCRGETKIGRRAAVDFLQDLIPESMLPDDVIVLEDLPRTGDGLVDRDALAAIGMEAAEWAIQPPETGTEELVATFWEEILERSSIGHGENFFDAGGESLSALRLALRIKEVFGAEIEVNALFESPTIRGMAGLIEQAIASAPAPMPEWETAKQREEKAVPSFAQERLWFVHELAQGGAQYNVPLALRLEGELDADALELSLRYIVRRHSVLRSMFSADGQGGVAVEISPDDNLEFARKDLLHVAEAARLSAVADCLQEEVQRAFHLDEPPLVRALLLRTAPAEHYVAVTIHHIACDGWSATILARELSHAYAAYVTGAEPRLPELQADYYEYAASQRRRLRGEFLKAQLDYWRQQLRDIEVLRLPSRPAKPQYHGGKCNLLLGTGLAAGLRRIAREETVTLFMALLGGWKLLLARYTSQNDIAVGAQVFNRPKKELEQLVGLFLNTLVLRTRLNFQNNFRQLLQDIRRTCLGAYAHQDVPFEQLVQEIAPTRDVAIHPLFQTMFGLQNAPKQPLNLDGLRVSEVAAETGTAKLDLALQAIVVDEDISLSLEYSSETFTSRQAHELLASYRELLQTLIHRAEEPLASIFSASLQSTKDEAIPDEAWAGMPEADLARQTVGSLFAHVCSICAKRTAISVSGVSLTYEDLLRNSRLISAAAAQTRGVKNGRIAILCEPRSPAMLACVMGALLANKTYVPLDASWPVNRIRTILADVEPAALLFDENCRAIAASLADHGSGMLDHAAIIQGAAPAGADVAVDPDQLAYVLYTSGSTGTPKGVMQSHRNLLRHIRNYANGLRLDSNDRMSLFPSYCYDAAIMDIFGALLTGASLHPLDPSALTADEMAERIRRERLTILHMTPTVFRHLMLAADAAQLTSVRAVVLGGEETGTDIVPLFRQRFSTDCLLVNGLGPTECTLALQYYYTTTHERTGKLPVGRPVPGISLTLVDAEGRPGGLEGEIVLCGEQIALGYWRRPDLTGASFRPAEGGRRAYHTGDLGQVLLDGNIGYAGRKDSQIKVQGSRVELREIEVAILRIEGISAAAVLVEDDNTEKQLHAFFTANREMSGDEVRAKLAETLPRYMLPASLSQVPEIPIIPNGKVDRQKLLAGRVAASGARPFRLYRTWLERALVGIWEEVLNVRPISIDDDFFALGGRSLLVPRLLGTVLRTIGCRLPLSALFEAPTVERMAQLIATTKGQDQNSPLVPIQPSGKLTPLFLVHPLSGEVLSYRHLVAALGQKQPCYGLQDPTITSGTAPMESIEEMAAVYCKAIQTVLPDGPWLLGGWSYGGVVAFEMARQLTAAGGEVKSLLLIDSWAPGPDTRTTPLDDTSLLIYIADVGFNLVVPREALQGKSLEEQIALIAAEAGPDARLREFLSASLRREREIIGARRRCLRAYDPGQYEGAVTLFYAADEALQQERGIMRKSDLGWSGLCSRPLEIVDIPGTHRDIAFPPYVAELARQIQTRLSAATDSGVQTVSLL